MGAKLFGKFRIETNVPNFCGEDCATPTVVLEWFLPLGKKSPLVPVIKLKIKLILYFMHKLSQWSKSFVGEKYGENWSARTHFKYIHKKPKKNNFF